MLLSPVGLLQLPSNRTEKETLDVSEHELQISCEIQDADKHLSNQGVLKEIEGYVLHSYLTLACSSVLVGHLYLTSPLKLEYNSICPITLYSLNNCNLGKTCSKPNYAFLYETCSLEWLWFLGSILLIPTSLPTPFPSQEGNWSADGFCHWNIFLSATSQCKIAVITSEKG